MFSSNSASIPVSVSDDEFDDAPGRTRVRARRKRKKSSFRPNDGAVSRRLVRRLVRWWPVLLFLPAFGLLLLEASKLGKKTTSESIQLNPPKIREKKPPSANLDRLDPVLHVVGGVKERCLKILPPEQLQHLDLPFNNGLRSPIKNLLYISETNNPYEHGNLTSSAQKSEGGRFNLFTGYQTLNQRQKSFEVRDNHVVHCGFFSDKGGFEISEDDKRYMNSCKVVVSTCAFGGGDDLYQPIGMSETSLEKVCYVAFWDEITLHTQDSQGQRIRDDHYVGKWRIVVVKHLPFVDQRLNGKIPKMLAHRLFPNSRFSIWVDSKSQFRRDPLGVLESLLWRMNSVLAISEHGARSNVYDEAVAVVHKNKATPEEVEIQISQYRHDGLPVDKRLNGKKALNEASIIAREHTPLTNLFMCLWFNEVVRFTSRDQLSFPYVRWRLKALKDINIFPVCTRKDLVNSMGHIRKAKPLVNLTRSN